MNHSNTPLQNRLTAWLLRKTPATGVRRIVSLAAGVASDIGNVRNENQDRAAIARGLDSQGQDFVVAAVADGMGGMRNGSECAALTMSTFLSAIHHQAMHGHDSSVEWLLSAVNEANHVVHSKFMSSGGATLVAVLIREGHPPHWLSVGDSRVYLWGARELAQISVDDTIAGQLGKNSDVPHEQSKLLQFIGMGSDLEPHIKRFEAESSGTAILTTDGVHYLANSYGLLERIIENAPDAGACTKRLIELAKWCGGHDNATIAMLPLSLERKEDYGADQACLEVWDAFGEIQIISDAAIKAAPTFPKKEKSIIQHHINASAEGNYTSKRTLIEKENGGLYPPKERRLRLPKKPKPSAEKKPNNPEEKKSEDAPQLLMEFPSKK